MNAKKPDFKTLTAKAAPAVAEIRRFSLVLFIIFVALLYGFVLLRINNLGSAEPSPDSVTSQVQAARVPHIDESVVKQLESLQNNSVNVQALFNQARSNPFQQ
jgi:cell shape-determining protein MreC